MVEGVRRAQVLGREGRDCPVSGFLCFLGIVGCVFVSDRLSGCAGMLGTHIPVDVPLLLLGILTLPLCQYASLFFLFFFLLHLIQYMRSYFSF